MSNTGFKLTDMTTWVTSECDLRCKYCFVYKLNEKQPAGKMTKETADQLMRFANQNLDPNGSIWFFGAEPLCNVDIIRYIVETSRVNGHNWRFGATTNCTLLTEELVQWMKKYNFGLNCSIDGLRDSHNRNRIYPDGSGSWDDAWRGISLIRKYLTPTPQIRWTVTPATTKGLADGIKTLVEEYKLTSLAVDMVYEVQWTPEDLAILKRELEIFRDYYAKWMSEGTPVFSMFIRDTNAALTTQERKWCSRCGLGQGSVGVDYDGSLYPCHRFIDSHKIKIGNIFSGFNTARQDWMNHWSKVAPYCEVPQKCLTCNYKNACTGGCIAMNYDVFDVPYVNLETFCSIKQLIVETLSDVVKSLQSNQTFQKVYQTNRLKQTSNTLPQTQPPTPCGCSDKTNQPNKGGAKNE
jgi:uncharacterized protein